MDLLLYIFTFIVLGFILSFTTTMSLVLIIPTLIILFYLFFKEDINKICFQKDIDEQQTEI